MTDLLPCPVCEKPVNMFYVLQEDDENGDLFWIDEHKNHKPDKFYDSADECIEDWNKWVEKTKMGVD